MNDQRDNRLVKLATLWERTSAKGRQYYSGFMGDAQLLMFVGKEVTRDNGEVVQTWKLFAQERDLERRPRRKEQPPAHDAERGVSTSAALSERADAWSKRQPPPDSGDPGQHGTGDPSRPLDDEVPF
jgi:hypothetical protein